MAIDKKQILVAGGGIAGLTCALALARKGYHVDVFEQAEKIETLGAGLQLSPNAMYALSDLDLMRQIQVVSTAPQAIRILDGENDEQICQLRLGSSTVTRYGYPYYVVHRADLLQVLLARCQDTPGINVHLGHKVTDMVQHQNGITLFAALPKGGGKEFQGAFLVAADGVWSKIRTNLLQLEGPVYSGLTAWRGMLRKEAFLRDDVNTIGAECDLENTCVWFHPGSHGVSYPVRSGQALNLVLIHKEPAPERDMDGRFEFHKLPPFDPQNQLAGWSEKWPGRLLDPKAWTRWPIYRINKPILKSQKWFEGPVVMIGDAAHAMVPFSAQGAAMAIEDAHQLADCLDKYKDPKRAFLVFSHRRRPRVSKTIELAEKNRSIYHMSRPFSDVRNLSMKLMGERLLMMRQNWLYDWKGY